MKNLYTIILALFISATVFGQTQGISSGDGSFDDPYDVATAIANNSGNDVWVNGFIVGNIEVGDVNEANLSAPFVTNTNLYIAPTAAETDTTKMLIIQLKTAVRPATNLVDNPGNIGKEIKFKGDLMPYFSVAGLKETNGYWLDGNGLNPDYPATIVIKGTSAIVTSVNETFDGGTPDQDLELAGWLNANKQGERYWIGKEYEGTKYAQFSGYGATYTNLESWLVTPGVLVSNGHKLMFDTRVGYWKHNALTVYISSNFDGNNDNLFTSTWTDITSDCNLPTEPEETYGPTFTTDFDLSSYAGETIYVLFKYTGDNSVNTTTMQLDNVQITNSDNVKELQNNTLGLNIYPNPSTGIVTVNSVVGSQILIYNIVGELVFNEFANSENTTVNLSSFQAGNYIVKVVADNKVSTKKLTLTK